MPPLATAPHPLEPLEPLVRRLIFHAAPGNGTVIGVTSALDGEGKTTVALHLATRLSHFAGGDRPVAFIEGGRPSRLSEGIMRFGERVWQQVYGAQRLEWYRSETIQPAGRTFAGVLMGLRRRHTFAVLDMPSLLTDPLAAELAREPDELYLVVRAGATRADTVRRALDLVDRTRVQGVILNGFHRSTPRWLAALVA